MITHTITQVLKFKIAMRSHHHEKTNTEKTADRCEFFIIFEKKAVEEEVLRHEWMKGVGEGEVEELTVLNIQNRRNYVPCIVHTILSKNYPTISKKNYDNVFDLFFLF